MAPATEARSETSLDLGSISHRARTRVGRTRSDIGSRTARFVAAGSLLVFLGSER
jgi:hypothetical protein